MSYNTLTLSVNKLGEYLIPQMFVAGRTTTIIASVSNTGYVTAEAIVKQGSTAVLNTPAQIQH